MDKATQRQTIHNAYNELLRLTFIGADSEKVTAIKGALGAVHDALVKELNEAPVGFDKTVVGETQVVAEAPVRRGRGPAKRKGNLQAVASNGATPAAEQESII